MSKAKPRRKYTPGHCINPLTAFGPSPASEQMRIMAYFWSALESVTRGASPDSEDWRALSDAINTVETLASLGSLPRSETMVYVNKAIAAMVGAANRFKEGKGMRFTGEGLEDVRAVVSIYEQAMAQLSALSMGRAQIETQRRVNAKLKSRSAEVVAL